MKSMIEMKTTTLIRLAGALSLALTAACSHNAAAPAAAPMPAPAPVAVTPTPDPAAAPATPAAGIVATGVASCDQLQAAIIKFENCPKLPPEAHDQIKLQMDAQNANFTKLASMKPEEAQAAAPGCQQGLDQVNQASTQLGCP